MSKSDREYLEDMLQQTHIIAGFTQLMRDEFDKNLMIQYAVARAYEIIGEIAKRLPNELLMQQPDAEWERIKGFRDYLAHNYDKIQPRYLWEAVEKLPQLQQAIQALLSDLSEEEE
ncbi:MAG: DUF86 domain-containing protein [Anaerolineae bacterium]|nr:DUF86 domain-containing protein [Anaerolineae bacterium]